MKSMTLIGVIKDWVQRHKNDDTSQIVAEKVSISLVEQFKEI